MTLAISQATTRLRAASVLICTLLAGGCASVESTMVTRDETNQYWERHNCLNGIPITLKVPTHLKLYLFHMHYLQPVLGGPKCEDIVDYCPVNMGVVVRDFAQEFMYTEKVFVVDFKRPAAGSANLRLKMTDQQYIDRIQHDITDNTIAQARNVLAAVTGTEFETVSEKAPQSKKVVPIKSLVAVGIYEIDSPDFEQKVRDFMECHVNKSHDAWVVPPGVDYINRTNFGPQDNREVPYPPVPLCAPGELPLGIPSGTGIPVEAAPLNSIEIRPDGTAVVQ